jgi:hypothetical protein
MELRNKSWLYEPLTKINNYEGLSSIRLKDGFNLIEDDRLIFKEYSNNI